jgi:hypothetical protein
VATQEEQLQQCVRLGNVVKIDLPTIDAGLFQALARRSIVSLQSRRAFAIAAHLRARWACLRIATSADGGWRAPRQCSRRDVHRSPRSLLSPGFPRNRASPARPAGNGHDAGSTGERCERPAAFSSSARPLSPADCLPRRSATWDLRRLSARNRQTTRR